jgi:hypothetical protein
MMLHFTPPLPCDCKLPTGRLCGRPASIGLVRPGGDGWRLTPICGACARVLAVPRVKEARHA